MTVIPLLYRQQKRIKKLCLLLGSSMVPSLLWSIAIKPLYSPARADIVINPTLQLHYFFSHPFTVSSMVFRGFRHSLLENYYNMTGVMGWLDTPVPHYILWTQGAMLIVVATIGNRKEQQPEGTAIDRVVPIMNFSIVSATLYLIYLAMYLSWNVVGHNQIDGVQGRYFLPLAPLILLIIPPLLRVSSRTYGRLELLGWLWWIYMIGATLNALRSRYWTVPFL
jgi:uncharacterized membrane protein